MSIPEERKYSLSEYKEIRNNTDRLVEYLDGVILMSPSPSVEHQRIAAKLTASLYNLLEGTRCEVFPAPFDVELSAEHVEGQHIVIPDLSVICDEGGFTKNKYIGVPELIIEIISPSNRSHDLVYKLDVYMRYGVKEYWIVNPLLKTIQLYALNEQRHYDQIATALEKGRVSSRAVEGFEIQLADIF